MKAQRIKFICIPDAIIFADSRKEAISMIHKGVFEKCKNVIVSLSSGEQFNLHSPRSKEYFGLRI